MKRGTVLGIYDDFEAFMRSLEALRGMGIERIFTYTPVPYDEINEVLEEKESPIRYFTLTGGLLGFASGAALTIFCSEVYSLIVGGKPIISIPPYLVIAFELTILLSTILTAIGYFLLSPVRRPNIHRSYDPSFSEDHLGILVEGPDVDTRRSGQVMEENGAVEIRS
jgi:molybdopterin-containing oxidoreductase family membrane subunit